MERILVETSVRLGKSPFEIMQKGSCPGEPICTHKIPEAEAVKQGQSRRICYCELIKKRSCKWGAGKCRFSHNISDDEPIDENFIASQRITPCEL